MSPNFLTGLLADQVLRWRVCPDRFLLGERHWKPRSYFQPTERAADAFRLLTAANADEYSITRTAGGRCSAKVKIAGSVGNASELSEALAITVAIARAIGINVEVID